jgi:hypothetical protein
MHDLQRRVVTELWERIFAIASVEFPVLGMKAPGVKKTASDWVVWKGSLPPHISLDWKIRSACVDLSFLKGCPQMRAALSAVHNLADTRLIRTTSTIALRTVLEPPEEPWTAISDTQIRQALQAAECLLSFYRQVLTPMSPQSLEPPPHDTELAL